MRSDLRDFKAIFPIFPFLFESILALFEASTITITPFSNLPPKQELSSEEDVMNRFRRKLEGNNAFLVLGFLRALSDA